MKGNGKKVYVIKFAITYVESGSVVFSNLEETEDALEITAGSGDIFPKVEQALDQMAKADSITVELIADDAFGPPKEEAVQLLPLDKVPEELRKLDEHIEFELGDGNTLAGKVIKVDEENVTVDFNHPLAGRDLKVDLILIDIK